MPNTQIHLADFSTPEDAQALIELMQIYATDPMGGGKAIDQGQLEQLPQQLFNITGAYSVLAFVDDQPAGLINCFAGFSTFAGKPLVNIHDVIVRRGYRQLGLAKQMLQEVERIAQARGCCKITLECLTGNPAALSLYRNFGFSDYELDPEAGTAIFLDKKLQ